MSKCVLSQYNPVHYFFEFRELYNYLYVSTLLLYYYITGQLPRGCYIYKIFFSYLRIITYFPWIPYQKKKVIPGLILYLRIRLTSLRT